MQGFILAAITATEKKTLTSIVDRPTEEQKVDVLYCTAISRCDKNQVTQAQTTCVHS